MYLLNCVYERSCDEDENTRIHTSNMILYKSKSYERLYNKMLEQILDDIIISYEEEIEEINGINGIKLTNEEEFKTDYLDVFFNDMKSYIQYNLKGDNFNIIEEESEEEESEDNLFAEISEKKEKKEKKENEDEIDDPEKSFSSIYKELLEKIFIRIEKDLLKIRVLDFYMYEIINFDKIEGI